MSEGGRNPDIQRRTIKVFYRGTDPTGRPFSRAASIRPTWARIHAPPTPPRPDNPPASEDFTTIQRPGMRPRTGRDRCGARDLRESLQWKGKNGPFCGRAIRKRRRWSRATRLLGDGTNPTVVFSGAEPPTAGIWGFEFYSYYAERSVLGSFSSAALVGNRSRQFGSRG